jgi:hypothetical protein
LEAFCFTASSSPSRVSVPIRATPTRS